MKVMVKRGLKPGPYKDTPWMLTPRMARLGGRVFEVQSEGHDFGRKSYRLKGDYHNWCEEWLTTPTMENV